VRSFAPDIGKSDNKIAGDFSLNSETPLLRVWPACLDWNRRDVQGISRTGRGRRMRYVQRASAIARIERWSITNIANAGITERMRLGHAQH